MLHQYVITKYPPYITTRNAPVIIIDGNSPVRPIDRSIVLQNFIPTIECMIAMKSGNPKNSPICLNNALFSIFSSAPSFLSITYLSLLSVDSDNSFKASIAALEIRNIIPR